MSSCFLFGHANTPQSALSALMEAIENEVSRETKIFYVGYHGNFDRMAIAALRRTKQKYSNIIAVLVLPYHHAAYHIAKPDGFDIILYPPLENVPKRYAHVRANQYMIRVSDCVLCYVRHFGKAEISLSMRKVMVLQQSTLLESKLQPYLPNIHPHKRCLSLSKNRVTAQSAHDSALRVGFADCAL